jgi:hypothetical protein
MVQKIWEYVESPEKVRAKGSGTRRKERRMNAQEVRPFGKKNRAFHQLKAVVIFCE